MPCRVLPCVLAGLLAAGAAGAADPAALVSTAVTPGLDPAQLADAGAWDRIRLLNGGALPAGGSPGPTGPQGVCGMNHDRCGAGSWGRLVLGA